MASYLQKYLRDNTSGRRKQSGDALAEIAATALQAPLPRKQQLEAELCEQKKLVSETFPLEENLYKLLQERVDALEKQLNACKFDAAYKRIDMSFMHRLKWSKELELPVPLFAMFTLDNPLCILAGDFVRINNFSRKPRFNVEDTYPPLFGELFNVERWLEAVAECYGAWKLPLSLTVRFAGVIPPAPRDKIKTALRCFDEVFLVTEAPEWKEEEVPLRGPDPLAIGRSGDSFWLVDAFDLTPLERATAGEWTI